MVAVVVGVVMPFTEGLGISMESASRDLACRTEPGPVQGVFRNFSLGCSKVL